MFLIGENGSGKSTLIEAIAVLAGFNAEGGSKNFRFGTRRSESCLHPFMRPVRGHRRSRDGFFLRAESYFNVATEIERLDEESDPLAGPPLIGGYGGVSLQARPLELEVEKRAAVVFERDELGDASEHCGVGGIAERVPVLALAVLGDRP